MWGKEKLWRSGDSWHREALVSLILELGAWGHWLQGRPGCGCASRGLWPLMPHLLVWVASLLFSWSVISDSLETPWMVARRSSVNGISQARTLECIAIFSSRGSSWPSDLTCVSCTGGWILYYRATWEAQLHQKAIKLLLPNTEVTY